MSLCSLISGFGHERGRPHCDRRGRTEESGGEHNMLGTAQFPAHADLLSSFQPLCVSIKKHKCVIAVSVACTHDVHVCRCTT